MSSENLLYFKFNLEIIRSKLWAQLSATARTLYPVLLSFSDGSFKPVYPGTKTLLKLTGFKHKASLQNARQELREKGLLTFSKGSGRKNTYYQFCFNFLSDGGGDSNQPQGGRGINPRGAGGLSSGANKEHPPYNQIHISIDNYPLDQKMCSKDTLGKAERDRWEFLKRRFGTEAVRLASSECHLANMADSLSNVEKVLYRNSKKKYKSWSEIKRELCKQISPVSLDLICRSYVKEERGLLLFKDDLPEHLKTALQAVCGKVFFEPVTKDLSVGPRLLKG